MHQTGKPPIPGHNLCSSPSLPVPPFLSDARLGVTAVGLSQAQVLSKTLKLLIQSISLVFGTNSNPLATYMAHRSAVSLLSYRESHSCNAMATLNFDQHWHAAIGQLCDT